MKKSHVLLMGAMALSLAITSGAVAADDAYQVVPGWPSIPQDDPVGECAGIGVDSHNHVFFFHRGEKPIRMVDADSGKTLNTFGAGIFINAHGLEIDHEDNVWVTDTRNHQVFKFAHDGKLLMTVGVKKSAGVDKIHFNQPTDVAVAPNGDFYVSDGYGNSRVVKFSADGRYIKAWGKKGDAPGDFNLPHGITLDPEGRVYVADRSNLRIQVFTPDGEFITQWKNEGPGRPWGLECASDGLLYVMDGGDLFAPADADKDTAKIIKRKLTGEIVEQWGSFGSEPGQLSWGHDVAVGPDGAVYTVEVRHNNRVQKFVKK